MSVWERQENEPANAFEAFAKYRDRGPTRSLYGVYMGSTAQQRLEWFNAYAWKARALEYDKHLDRIRLQEREATIKEQERAGGDERKEIVNASLAFAKRELEKLRAASDSGEMPIKIAEYTKLLETCIKLSRLEDEKSTENVKHEDYSDLPADLLREMQALMLRVDKWRREH